MSIFNIFRKKPETKTINNQQSDTFVDILISLNKEFEIDLSLFIDCDYNKFGIDESDYALLCSKLINFDHIKIKNQLIDILISQIKNDKNKHLIDLLVRLVEDHVAESKLQKLNNSYDHLFIKPSQVFAKNIHEHQ